MTDEHDPADRPAPDAELMSDEKHQDLSNRSKSKVVRAGWITCIVGLIVTLAGARQLATGGDAFNAVVRAIHSTGLLILLAGFGIALLGYRLPWLVAVTRSLRFSVGPRTGLTTNAGHRSLGTWHLSRVTMAIVLTFCGWSILSLILIWLGPSSLVGLYICLMTFFLTSATIVVIANGSPLQRAFGIGALIPLLIVLLQLWLEFFSAWSSFSWRRSGYFGRGWDSIEAQLEMLWEMLAGIGLSGRMLVTVMGFTALLTGIMTMAVRIVLHQLNESRLSQESQLSQTDEAAR